MPEISPPPPIGITSTSRSATSSSISSAIGALAGDDMRIVVGMHPDQAALARLGFGARLRLADGLAVEQHLRAMRLGRRHLHERRRHRHHDGRGDPQARRVVGDRLGVVAGRHGDDAARPLGRRQRGELGARAALLERVGDLEIFVFDEDLGAGQRRQPRRRQHRRAQHVAGDDAPRGFDVGKGYGQASAHDPGAGGNRRAISLHPTCGSTPQSAPW